MSHFYGVVQGNRGGASRGGSRKSGIDTVAASWAGAIRVRIWFDKETNRNRFEVYQDYWHGHGIRKTIATGIVGQED